MKEIAEIQSEELREFMPYTPRWITRFGNTIILVIVIGAILLAQLIRYPETVVGEVTITTETPSVKLVNKISGKLEKLFVKNDSLLTKGTLIAEIENPSASSDIEKLRQFLASIVVEDNKVLFDYSFKIEPLKVGDAQSDYTFLLYELDAYKKLIQNNYYPEKIRNLEQQITTYKKLAQLNLNSKGLFEQELHNTEAKIKMNEKLFLEKVIPVSEFQEKQNELLNKRQGLNSIEKSILETTISISEFERQKLDFQNQFREKIEACLINTSRLKNNLDNFINTWRKNYTVVSPIDGRIVFSQNIFEKQHVTGGETLFLIVPGNENYIGIINTSSERIGKLKVGQDVLVSLAGFPVHDFGKVPGKVIRMLSTPNENAYTLIVSFGSTLKSTYGVALDFKPEMTGTAEIIVDQASFLERILKNIRKAFQD
jgi:multidrug resistance efflux pump